MNIAQAKDEIKRALQIYFRKDETGMYTCPPERQRPILLIGPPGIGKTAVMEQIARECNVGLVAYTMTHHTRQSAIGLPRIVSREYDGVQTHVTEYTLSEIVASVRDCTARTGLTEGILFIDEINCVSETLAPVMLQLLQSKTFGMHPVPSGWLICAAGNPPEYNRSARPFDLVTLDRVRCIPIEPDLDCWLDYAVSRNLHEAVLSFLQMNPEAFYQAESSAARQVFVTARGWEDLSFLIRSSEQLGLPLGESQIRQYLGSDRTAKEFAAYYRLCCTCRTDYDIRSILDGSTGKDRLEAHKTQLQKVSFEERYLISSMILGILCREMEAYQQKADLYERLLDFSGSFTDTGASDLFRSRILEEEVRMKKRKAAGLLPPQEEHRQRALLHLLEQLRERSASGQDVSFPAQNAVLAEELAGMQKDTAHTAQNILEMLEKAFSFAGSYCAEDQEMLVLVSGLSRNKNAVRFLSRYRSEPFLEWSARLLPD